MLRRMPLPMLLALSIHAVALASPEQLNGPLTPAPQEGLHATAPSLPAHGEAEVTDDGQLVRLSWHRTSHLQRFHVYRQAGDRLICLTTSAFDGEHFYDHVTADASLQYRVVLLNPDGAETQEVTLIRLTGYRNVQPVAPLFSPLTANAMPFDKNTIISDLQMVDYTTMTSDEIQSFLTAYGSPLATYSFNGMSAAEIIKNECELQGINPQAVLTTVQKEMSLITSGKANPDYCAMGWDSCHSVNDFTGQIHKGTLQYRAFEHKLSRYTDVKGNPWAVGALRYVNDGTVTATTTATAGLYAYTPYIGGTTGIGANYLFWNTWYNKFGFGSDDPPSPDPDVLALAGTSQPVLWYYIYTAGRWYIVDASNPFGSDSAVMLLNRIDLAFPGKLRWKPINNYPTFADFPAAGDNFSYVAPSFDGRSISFGDLVAPTQDPDVAALANATVPVSWFYIFDGSDWYIVQATSPFSSDAYVYLLRVLDPDYPGEIRWKPINSVDGFGGYPAATTNYSYVSTSFTGTSVDFGGFNFGATAGSQKLSQDMTEGNTVAAPRYGLAGGPPGVYCFTLTTQSAPATGGTTVVATGENCSGGFTGGTTVSISATANPGYAFSGWQATNCNLANATASATTCALTGNGNAAVIASFAVRASGVSHRRAVRH